MTMPPNPKLVWAPRSHLKAIKIFTVLHRASVEIHWLSCKHTTYLFYYGSVQLIILNKNIKLGRSILSLVWGSLMLTVLGVWQETQL